MKYCVLLLVVGTALGVPILPDAEDVQCNSLFQYKKQYTFTYTGTTETGIIGTDDVIASTRITCQNVVIRVPQKCTLTMDLNSCSISPETEQTRELASSLQNYQLMARVGNGLITEVLPDVRESVEVLNLKRGILSALQMEFHGQVEPELHSRHLSTHGNCSTTTTHLGHEGQYQEDYIVRKDLSTCTERPTKTPMLWRGLTYLQNLNLGEALLNSSQECHYELYDIQGLHMQYALCKEVHSFWPGSISSDRGIMTTITQELGPMTLAKLNSLDFEADRYKKGKTSIVQELPEKESPERITSDEAMEVIKSLVVSSLDEVKVDTPRLFGKWVKALQSLDNATIHDVFEKTYNCKKYSEKCRALPGKAELAREYLWDGLIQCGTLECFAVINTAIIKDIIPKPLANVMMYTMAFRDYPTEEIITEGVRLAHYKRDQSVILPISTMIYRYWIDNPELHDERELPQAIREFVALMDEILNNDCTVEAERGTTEAIEAERQMLLALKAIGNLGPVAQKFNEPERIKRLHLERTLVRCAANQDVSRNVSLSALQGLRRFDPTVVSTFVIQQLHEIMLTASYEVELRIAAFLMYMKTNENLPIDRDTYVVIKENPSKQFKSFALSYIGNILESEDPTVQRLRKDLLLAIGEEELPEYPMNIFKYSTNIELSKLITLPYFNKTFGGSIESNLIYDSKAAMPRSMMIKLAMNVLGKDWEAIESGVEIHGFDSVMKIMFGPEGYFPSNVLKDAIKKADDMIMTKINETIPRDYIDWLTNALEVLINGTQSTFAPKKSAEPQPEPLPEGMEEVAQQVDEANKEKVAAAHLRILGNELGYITLDDLKSLIPSINNETLMNMYNTIGDKLSQGVEVNTTRSIVFLERHLVLPTGIGMPLNCSANGTAVISVRSRGHFSVSMQPSASISARFAPSASLELVGTMGIHVPKTKIYSAVMANASIYHNSELEGNFTLVGPAVKVHLKPVKRDLNLLKVALDYYVLLPNGEVHVVQGIMQDAVNYKECLTTGRILGATLCLSFAYPNASFYDIAPRFPLTGPIRFELSLNNVDESLESYVFEAKYEKIVKGGAGTGTKPVKPVKKFGLIGKKGKRSASVASEEIIDMIHIGFSAPGDMMERNISSVMTFNRKTTEAKWILDASEMEGLRLFAGLLNITDEASSGMHLVWNATYMEKDASVSLTLKNSSVEEMGNYTAVFNASAECLHFASVAQLINTPNFKIASFNQTYYWDDETSLYDQLTFMSSGYQIRQEKYRQSVAYIKSTTKKQVTNSILHISTLGQNFTIESEALTKRSSYNNELSAKFANQWIDFPMANFTYRFDDNTKNRIRQTTRYIDIKRGEHGLFYQEDGEKYLRTGSMTRNYTFGIVSQQKIIRPAFADIEDQELLARYTEEQLYDFWPVNLNTTLHFTYVNEEEVPSHFTALNVSVSVPQSRDLRDQTRWGFGSTFRFVNKSSTPEYHAAYALQFNQTIPLLLLDFSNEFTITNTTEGLNFSFSHQSMERKYGKKMNLDMFSNVEMFGAQTGLNFTSPYYNYSGSFVVDMDEAKGIVIRNAMAQKGGVIPDFTDFLSDDYVTVNLWKNATAGFQITHRLLNVSTNHMVNLEGPITDFEIRAVPYWIKDLVNDTLNGGFEVTVEYLEEVYEAVTSSSLMVGNDFKARMPYIFNVTMENGFFVSAERINHTLVMLVKRPGVNLNVDHTLIGPADNTNYYTINTDVTGNVGTVADLRSTVTGKAKFGKTIESNLVMTTAAKVPRIANITVDLTHTIERMKSITSFSAMDLTVETNVDSCIGTSNMVSSAKFETFKKLYKFSKAEVGMTSEVVSRFLNVTSMNGWTITGFSDLLAFARMNTTNALTVVSPLVNVTMSSIHEITDVRNITVGGITSTSSYQVDSLLGDANSTFGWEVTDFNSPLNFTRSNGSSSFTMSSKFINITNTQSIDFVGMLGPFTFDKVSGKVNWIADTIFGSVSVVPMFELNNFQGISSFDSAIAGADMVVESEYIGTSTVMAKTGIYEMTDVMQFNEANVTVDASVEMLGLEASLNSKGKIKGMNGYTTKSVIGKTQYSVTSRFLNVTGDMSSVTKTMTGPFTFQTMTNMWKHNDKTPISSLSLDIMSEMSGVVGLFTHALMSQNIGVNWTMPLGKVETSFVWSRENAGGLFNFETGSMKLRNAFTSRLVNMTIAALGEADGMTSFFVFREFTTDASAKVTVGDVLDVVASRTSSTTGSTSITSFELFTIEESATITTPIATITTAQDARMSNWRSLLSYDQFTGSSRAELASTLINASSEVTMEVVSRNGLFTFQSANIAGNAAVTSPLYNMDMEGSIVANEFTGFFTFQEFTTAASTQMNLWKVMNMTAAHSTVTTDSTSITSFGKFTMTNNATITTPVVVVEVAQGTDMINWVSLLQYDLFRTSSTARIGSTLLNVTNEMLLDINNRDGFFTFGNVKYGMTTNMTTPISVMKNSLGFEILDLVALTESTKIAAGVTNSMTSELGTFDIAAGFKLLGQRSLFAFDHTGAGANMTVVSRFVNMSIALGSEMVNSQGLFHYESFKMGSSGSLNTTIASMKAEGGIEVLEQTELFAIQKVSMGAQAIANSMLVNVSFGADALLQNLVKFMFFDRASHNASFSLVTDYQTMNHGYTSIMRNSAGVCISDLVQFEYNGINTGIIESTSQLTATIVSNGGFGVYDSLAITHSIDLTSVIINVTTANAFTITEATGPLTFTNGALTSGTTMTTPLGSTSMMHTVEMNGFRGATDFDEMTLISTGNATSMPINATGNFIYSIRGVDGLLKFNEMKVTGNSTAKSIVGDMFTTSTITMTKMRGLLKLDVFKMNHITTMEGPLSSLDLRGNALVRKAQNITTFKLLNSEYSMEFISLPMNVSSSGDFRVDASKSLFNVDLIEGNMVSNISTPIVSHNSSSSILLRDMTCLTEFGEIQVSNEMKTVTPLTISSVVLTIGGETNWASIAQELRTEMTTPAGTVQVVQLIDYENAKISLTLPEYAYVHLHAHLNEIGDELSIKIKHALKDQDLVEDLGLLLKLNGSNLVYTNFSWNPEVVAELMDISVDALNRTINYTMSVVNNTRDSLKSLLNLTKETIKELNATVQEIIENPRDFIQKRVDLARYDALMDKVEELKQKVEDLVNVTLEDPKQAVKDLYELIKVTLEEAKAIAKETFDQIGEQFMVREKIELLNRTITEYATYIYHPKETWEILKPKLEEYLEKAKENLMYDLVKETFFEIVDIPHINDTLREYIAKVNVENIKALLKDLKLLINTNKVQEVYDAVMGVELNVGCVTFKDLRRIDMEMINDTYNKIQEFLAVENLKQFINIAKVEEVTDRINQTIRQNLDLQLWNDTLRTYIDVPLLESSLVSVMNHTKTKLEEAYKSIKEQADAKITDLKIKVEELKEIVKEAVQLLNDTLKEASGLNWVQMKRKVQVAVADFSAGLSEKIYMEKIKEVLQELKENVTSKVDMTKINEAIDQFNNTLFIIINATKNESHPINLLPMRFAETTIYEILVSSLDKFAELSDEYGEITFDLVKEYGQKAKELFDEYKAEVDRLYEEYSEIVMDKANELYENATREFDIYREKAMELADNLTKKADQLRVQLGEKLVELNETLNEKYQEYSPLMRDFALNVTEISMDLARNISEYIVEKSEPLVTGSVELLEPYWIDLLDRLTTYKNNSLLYSEDMCINMTILVERTIEKLPEYKQQLLDLSEEYKEIAKEVFEDLKGNLTIFKEDLISRAEELKSALIEQKDRTWAEVIAMAKNEENLLNYYPSEWTGKTVFVLSEETMEYLNATAEELKILAERSYEDIKAKVDAKVEELKVIMADPTHKINRIPLEFLEMTLMQIYDEVKQNVTLLVEEGKTYVEVAKIFMNESIISLNETRLEYNITMEHLQDLIVEYVDQANSSLIRFLDWVEVAREQPYNVTMMEVVNKLNETLIQAVDTANVTFSKAVNITNNTLCVVKDLWNNLTREENLERVPVLLEEYFDLFIDTLRKINRTAYDTVNVTMRIVEILKEDTGIVEKMEEYRKILDEYKAKVEKKIAEYRPIVEGYYLDARLAVEEFLNLTKEAVFDRSISYVEYLNNTLPGWMYRYYKMDALPYQMVNYTMNEGKDSIFQALNRTMTFAQEVVGSFLEFNLDHNSLTVNLTHPFHWTSFRELPTLTEAQKEILQSIFDEIKQRVLLPGQYQFDRLSEVISLKYRELMVYVTDIKEDLTPKVEAKLQELRDQIEDARQKIMDMRRDFVWEDFKMNITKAKDYLQEQVSEKYDNAKDYLEEQVKENYVKAKDYLEEQVPAIIAGLKEKDLDDLTSSLRELLERLSIFIREMPLPGWLHSFFKPQTYKAMIFGADHVMTFNQLVYQHPEYLQPGCTYLLASDLADGKFRILVTEETTTLELVDPTINVKVGPGDEFFVNGDGTPATPPYESPEKDVVVTREGPWINVTTTYGVNMFCQVELFSCIYELSEKHYNKTHGLLGTLNTEHRDQLVLRDGSITENMIEWLNSYEVTGRGVCQFPDSYVAPTSDCSSKRRNALEKECEAIFNSDDSWLAPVYQSIDPRSFLKVCKEVDAVNCNIEELVVNYRALGAFEGIFVQPPGCPNQDLEEPCTYDRPVMESADVVFIVSESWRMTEGVTEETLMATLTNLYVSLGSHYPNPQFALVAYGGVDDNHCAPHLHSNGMEPFVRGNFERAFESLEFCADQESCICSTRKGDALRAVEFASQLQFRDNAGKVFIHIDNYEKDYTEDERLAVANILADNAVTYNIISEYKQLEKTIGKFTIIGVNYNGDILYDKRNITMNLSIPKGHYAKLATATDGAVLGYHSLETEKTSLSAQGVIKRLCRMQLDAYRRKDVVCKSVWDIYGMPTTRCTVV